MKVKVNQLGQPLCDPMDYTVHGSLQARILEWVAFPFSRGSSQPRDWTQVSYIVGRFFTSWITKKPLFETLSQGAARDVIGKLWKDGWTKAQAKLWLISFLFIGNLLAGTAYISLGRRAFLLRTSASGHLAIGNTSSWDTWSSYFTIFTHSLQPQASYHLVEKPRGTDIGFCFHYMLGTSWR